MYLPIAPILSQDLAQSFQRRLAEGTGEHGVATAGYLFAAPVAACPPRSAHVVHPNKRRFNFMKPNSSPAVKSATRAIDVLELVAGAENPPSFAEIGAHLGIPNSSLFYLLNTLIQRGYLQQDDNRLYTLGPAISRLANSVSAPVSWVKLVEPLLDRVWTQVQETTSYMERRGDEIECMISKLAPHSLLPVHRVGQRAPLYVFSGGKIVLAQLDDEALEAYLKRTQLKRLTPYTLASPQAIRREIGHVRSCGVAVSREEHSVGIIGVSVGLTTATSLAGTLGVAIPAVRFNEKVLANIKTHLQAAAARFSSSTEGATPPRAAPLERSAER
jgi:IclR family transcriptional regulator, acetate operon repressor